MGRRSYLISLFFVLGILFIDSNGLLHGKRSTKIKNHNQNNINKIINRGKELKHEIRAQYKKIFKSIRGNVPRSNLAPPIDIKNTKKIIKHNTVPGKRELKQTFAYVREKYQLRIGLSTTSRRLSWVYKNEKIEVKLMIRKRTTSVKNYTWYLIANEKGEEGFIPNVLLSKRPVKKNDKIKRIKVKVMFVNAYSGLNMRTKPNSYARKVVLIPNKSKIRVLSRSNRKEKISKYNDHWYKVQYYNDKGWVYGAFLNKKVKTEVIIADGKYTIPIKGRISSNFGYRIDPLTKRRGSFHTGMDIVAPKGSPIKAAQGGVIYFSKWGGGYGKLTIIQHKNNFFTYYAHQSRIRVRKGQKVKKGTRIGDVGTTGRSTGPHLHFEVRRGKAAVNPNKFMRF